MHEVEALPRECMEDGDRLHLLTSSMNVLTAVLIYMAAVGVGLPALATAMARKLATQERRP